MSDSSFHIKNNFFLLSLIFLIGCTANSSALYAQNSKHQESKMNGVNFRGPYDPYFNIDRIRQVKKAHAEWITFIPEVTLERTTLKLRPDSLNDFWGETVAANIEGIQLAKSLGLKVMLKPHIVLGDIPDKTLTSDQSPRSLQNAQKQNRPPKDKTRGAKWRGDFVARNNADWELWENSYYTFIIDLANIADSLNVDLFCIGTELTKSAIKRPAYWRNLIVEIRQIYSGPITYSANWDQYHRITFWEDLDYIAVNTYFPISISKTPRVRRTSRNWKIVRRKLKKFSKKNKKKILFSEFGYRNVDFAGFRPWLHDYQDRKAINNQAQINLYKAFFKTFWDQSWVAGGFCWQWFHKPPKDGNTTFSIQDKPALAVIQQWYKQVDR